MRRSVLLVLALALAGSGCAIVPQNRRAKLAEPTMAIHEDPLEAAQREKFHSTREGAAGGDGSTAGGGCGCR